MGAGHQGGLTGAAGVDDWPTEASKRVRTAWPRAWPRAGGFAPAERSTVR